MKMLLTSISIFINAHRTYGHMWQIQRMDFAFIPYAEVKRKGRKWSRKYNKLDFKVRPSPSPEIADYVHVLKLNLDLSQGLVAELNFLQTLKFI